MISRAPFFGAFSSVAAVSSGLVFFLRGAEDLDAVRDFDFFAAGGRARDFSASAVGSVSDVVGALDGKPRLAAALLIDFICALRDGGARLFITEQSLAQLLFAFVIHNFSPLTHPLGY